MNYAVDFQSLPYLKSTVLTFGFFDGVHLGHQKLLQKVVTDAKQTNSLATVVTFWPHPREVVSLGLKPVKLLTTQTQRKLLLEKNQIDLVLDIPFTLSFSKMSALDFLMTIKKNLKPKKIIVGQDYRFGYLQEGNTDVLASFCLREDIQFEILDKLTIPGTNQYFSSTFLRQRLLRHRK